MLFLSPELFGQTTSLVSNSQPGITAQVTSEKTSQSLNHGDWPSCVEALAAVSNLLLVIWLFILAHRQHRKERKAEIAGFWIQELIMRQHNKAIQTFFDDFEERLKKPAVAALGNTHQILREKASEEILAFNEQLHKITHQVIDPLQWIHTDFSALLPIRNDIQDLVTNELCKIPGVANQNVEREDLLSPDARLAELRRKFFQTIHKIQTRVILGSNDGVNE